MCFLLSDGLYLFLTVSRSVLFWHFYSSHLVFGYTHLIAIKPEQWYIPIMLTKLCTWTFCYVHKVYTVRASSAITKISLCFLLFSEWSTLANMRKTHIKGDNSHYVTTSLHKLLLIAILIVTMLTTKSSKYNIKVCPVRNSNIIQCTISFSHGPWSNVAAGAASDETQTWTRKSCSSHPFDHGWDQTSAAH